ncbi:MAG: hypothetical protein LBV75_09240 [Paludibacter sp.]|nr:hypothetical protein [Paludibacter sp.]
MLIHIFFTIIILFSFSASYAQDVSSAPERGVEQEAAKQTERMRDELNLTPEQVKKIYQINLKYAQQRQQSNMRSDAVIRIKNKDIELRKVLSAAQYELLQSKRYERSAIRPMQSANTSAEPATSPDNQTPETDENKKISTERRTSPSGSTSTRPRNSSDRQSGNPPPPKNRK